jgi:hypothetical protein
MPKARLDGRRLTRCTNIPGYEKKTNKGVFDDAQQELANREIALCKEVTRWIDDDRDQIVDLLLSPQGMARGYLLKWVEWAEKRGMPTLPAPTEYSNDQERDLKLWANFRALVDYICTTKEKVTGQLLVLKGTIEREKKKGEYVPLDVPNGEVDRVMRIWDALEEAYEDVMNTEDYYYGVLAKLGLSYAHPNEE